MGENILTLIGFNDCLKDHVKFKKKNHFQLQFRNKSLTDHTIQKN